MREQKTIGIMVGESLIVKNILRSGVLAHLKKAGYRIVLFMYCKEISTRITDEFADTNVLLARISEPKRRASERLFHRLMDYLIWNKTTKRYFRYAEHYVRKPRIVSYLYMALLRLISGTVGSVKPLRLFVRLIDEKVFPQKHAEVAALFDRYRVDLLFSTSINSKIDAVYLKEAKRRAILTVSMSKNWDGISRVYFRVIPDYFLAQNDVLRDELVSVQDVLRERIFVTGFPEFDWYARPDIIRSREEHLRKLGLDPSLPVIYFASQGLWFPKDYTIAQQIYAWIQSGKLVKKCQLLVRPHPHFLAKGDDPLKQFCNKLGVAYDDTYHRTPEFFGTWDPTEEETIDLVNSIHHADVLVVVLSTLALDGACANTPVINALFGSVYQKGTDITPKMLSTEHYGWIADTGGTSMVYSAQELLEELNRYLAHPDYKEAGRDVLKRKLCYTIDGRASQRMAQAMNDICSRSN